MLPGQEDMNSGQTLTQLPIWAGERVVTRSGKVVHAPVQCKNITLHGLLSVVRNITKVLDTGHSGFVERKKAGRRVKFVAGG